jgi:hypothetical protein
LNLLKGVSSPPKEMLSLAVYEAFLEGAVQVGAHIPTILFSFLPSPFYHALVSLLLAKPSEELGDVEHASSKGGS